MKWTTLLINVNVFLMMLLLAACKPQSQGLAPVEEKTIASISEEAKAEAFFLELEKRQAEDPDKIFEVTFDEPQALPVKSSIVLGSIVETKKVSAPISNQKFYVFIGLGDREKDQVTEKADLAAIYAIMNYASQKNYRILINVKATANHLKTASQDNDAAVVLWSSHGNDQGFYDSLGQLVPYDTLQKKSKNFYQFILASCDGKLALKNYYDHEGLVTWSWRGRTNSQVLRSFLLSDVWNIEDGKVLSTPNRGYTCTADGKRFSLMEVASKRKLINEDKFISLEKCEAKLKTLSSWY